MDKKNTGDTNCINSNADSEKVYAKTSFGIYNNINTNASVYISDISSTRDTSYISIINNNFDSKKAY